MEVQSQSFQSHSPQFVPFEEPYMIYEGFRLGFGLASKARAELDHALNNHKQVVVLIDDTKFPSDLFSFLQKGPSGLSANKTSNYQRKKKSFSLAKGKGSEELIRAFFEKRPMQESPDLYVFEQAKMQLAILDTERTQLAHSLPKSFSHPALAFIKQELEKTVSLEVAPKLVKTQMRSWGLTDSRVRAFSKLALENQVDS